MGYVHCLKVFLVVYVILVGCMDDLEEVHGAILPEPNHVPQMYSVPQMAYPTFPAQGITIQHGDVQLLGPEERVISEGKLGALFKAKGLVAKLKSKGLYVLKKAVQILGKFAVVGVIAFSVVAVAMTITAFFCKKTGFCNLDFHKIQLDKEQVEGVRSILADERVTKMTNFVLNAIDEHTEDEEADIKDHKKD